MGVVSQEQRKGMSEHLAQTENWTPGWNDDQKVKGQAGSDPLVSKFNMFFPM